MHNSSRDPPTLCGPVKCQCECKRNCDCEWKALLLDFALQTVRANQWTVETQVDLQNKAKGILDRLLECDGTFPREIPLSSQRSRDQASIVIREEDETTHPTPASSGKTVHLPFEIMSMIAKHLKLPEDLVAFCLVNKTWAIVAREMIWLSPSMHYGQTARTYGFIFALRMRRSRAVTVSDSTTLTTPIPSFILQDPASFVVDLRFELSKTTVFLCQLLPRFVSLRKLTFGCMTCEKAIPLLAAYCPKSVADLQIHDVSYFNITHEKDARAALLEAPEYNSSAIKRFFSQFTNISWYTWDANAWFTIKDSAHDSLRVVKLPSVGSKRFILEFLDGCSSSLMAISLNHLSKDILKLLGDRAPNLRACCFDAEATNDVNNNLAKFLTEAALHLEYLYLYLPEKMVIDSGFCPSLKHLEICCGRFVSSTQNLRTFLGEVGPQLRSLIVHLPPMPPYTTADEFIDIIASKCISIRYLQITANTPVAAAENSRISERNVLSRLFKKSPAAYLLWKKLAELRRFGDSRIKQWLALSVKNAIIALLTITSLCRCIYGFIVTSYKLQGMRIPTTANTGLLILDALSFGSDSSSVFLITCLLSKINFVGLLNRTTFLIVEIYSLLIFLFYLVAGPLSIYVKDINGFNFNRLQNLVYVCECTVATPLQIYVCFKVSKMVRSSGYVRSTMGGLGRSTGTGSKGDVANLEVQYPTTGADGQPPAVGASNDITSVGTSNYTTNSPTVINVNNNTTPVKKKRQDKLLRIFQFYIVNTFFIAIAALAGIYEQTFWGDESSGYIRTYASFIAVVARSFIVYTPKFLYDAGRSTNGASGSRTDANQQRSMGKQNERRVIGVNG
ncbi:hypothetical protein HK102_000360 [Quaeritorhiza haematococci]|nr:hypothetical protein HK102_000360 [Quaeritorhiza haematococci]